LTDADTALFIGNQQSLDRPSAFFEKHTKLLIVWLIKGIITKKMEKKTENTSFFAIFAFVL
jgi:hypothetical protein